MQKKIMIFTADYCPYCKKAKALLTQRGIHFEETQVNKANSEWEALCKRSGMKTIPQIFAADQLIGGYSDLEELDRQDGLKSLK